MLVEAKKRMNVNAVGSFIRDGDLEELYNEIIEHNNMCKEAAEKLYGREDLITEVSLILMAENFIYDNNLRL